jgi:hypothetical protein
VTALLDPAATAIFTFDFDSLGEATITGTNISLIVEPGIAVTNLAPTFTMAPAATASPRSGTSRDFTTPQTYTITARNGSTRKYNVMITRASPESANDSGSTNNGASRRNGLSALRRRLTAQELRALKQMPTLPTTNYTVRLYFMEPDDVKPGQRVFDVRLQDRSVLNSFDVVKEAGGVNRGIVKEFKHIEITKELEVRLERELAAPLGPVLSGLELILEPGSK